MLSKRRTWLERIAHWGTALAVPLVAIIGFRLLAHARDAAAPRPGENEVAARAVPAAAAGRVLAPPIDASGPPVVELRPSRATGGQAPVRAAGTSEEDPRCEELERLIRQVDEEALRAADSDAARQRRDRGAASRAEARRLRCRVR
jgi:hypothetical protein